MPALLSHCIYGDKTLIASGVESLNRIIIKHKNAYYLGCQGPDVLMNYHLLPFCKPNKEVTELGSNLHHLKVNELFESLLKQAKEKMCEVLISYCCGFLCHHSLDSLTHPYIMYRSDSLKNPESSEHAAFEAELDFEVLCANHMTIDDVKPYKMVNCKKKERRIIAHALQNAIEESVGIRYPVSVALDSCKNMVQIQFALYDRHGEKYRLLKWFEEKTGKPGMATNMLIPHHHNDKRDVMNYRRERWYNPADDTVSYTETFEELGAKAIKEGTEKFKAFYHYLYEDGTLNDVLIQIGNRSYETGLPINLNKEMKYFKKDM